MKVGQVFVFTQHLRELMEIHCPFCCNTSWRGEKQHSTTGPIAFRCGFAYKTGDGKQFGQLVITGPCASYLVGYRMDRPHAILVEDRPTATPKCTCSKAVLFAQGCRCGGI